MAALNKHSLRVQLQGPLVPIQGAFAITAHDTNELANVTRAIWVGTTGNIKVVFAEDTTAEAVTLNAVPVGMYSWAVRQVYATGTTASNLLGLY